MSKSRKRRPKPSAAQRKELRLRLSAPVPPPRPKHPWYEQTCPDETLIDEFGEVGADWLQDAYGRPLTLADFALEQSIRTDSFLLDDPLTGPEVTTAEHLSRLIDTAHHVFFSIVEKQGSLPPELAREVAQFQAAPPVDYASEGVDVLRSAFEVGHLFLNDRRMWDLD